MKTRIQNLSLALAWVALLALPTLAQAQFTYITNGDNTITVTGYTGSDGVVVIPDTFNGLPVTSIGGDAFYQRTSLTSVTIPNSVTSIGDFAFYGCTSLTNIAVEASNPNYSSLNGVLFDKLQTTLVDYPGGLGGSYTIPNSVTSIGDSAFGSCTNLTSVTIPNGVTSIRDYVFEGCTGLTSVVIPNSITGIGSYAFSSCNNLTSAYFQGNAPRDYGTAFTGDHAGMTVYYVFGTTGWGSTFGGVPAVLWNPQATTFSLAGGHFGFSITGPTNATIVVEACTNLTNPVWLPVATNMLTGGASSFSDPQSVNYPSRFYRFRAQ